MTRREANSQHGPSGYLEQTRRPLNCLVFVLPLLAAYEVGALLLGHRLLAITHLKRLLDLFGVTGRFLPPLLVVAVLLMWHLASRQKWRPDGRALVGMAVESILWMVPLLLLAVLSRKLAPPAAKLNHAPGADILAYVGAGVYEEFIFRLGAVSLLLKLFLKVVIAPKELLAVAAVVLASVLFGLYHFIGPGQFAWGLFVFYAAAGAYLGGVYLARGFGIAVGAHACYNVLTSFI